MPPKICCLKKLRNATWQIPFRFGYQRYRPHAKPAPAAKAQVWIWYTQPKTNIFPENWWLEDDLPFNIFRFSADMLISRVYISGLCWIRATRATELEAASKFHHVGWQNLKTEHPCQQHASCKGSTRFNGFALFLLPLRMSLVWRFTRLECGKKSRSCLS